MTRLLASTLILASLALPTSSEARPTPIGRFLQREKPVQARQHYAFGKLRVPGLVARGLRVLGLGKQVRTRELVQVDNKTLAGFTQATAHGYLEVVVPANKGHVYFRHGGKVFDFYPGGLRVGAVRPIKSDRYGLLVKLDAKQEKRLARYLKRIEKTGGSELGAYDFQGAQGFHCVSWLMRATLGQKQGDNLVKLLGGRPRDGASMPRFARFMLKKAQGVEAVAVYKADPLPASQLGRLSFELMSSRQLSRAHVEEATR